MNNFIKVVSTLFVLVYYANPADADQWLYIDPLQPNEFFSIETNPDAIGMFDIRHPAEYCKLDNEFICIKSAEFEFFVPRDSSKLDKTWDIKGVDYQVTFKKNVLLFGIEDEIYYIDKTDHDGGILRFLYSTSRGLVGMGGFSKKSSAIFLLDVRCGYGAPSKCSELDDKKPNK